MSDGKQQNHEYMELMSDDLRNRVQKAAAAQLPILQPKLLEAVIAIVDQCLDDERRPARSAGGKTTGQYNRAATRRWWAVVDEAYKNLPHGLQAHPYSGVTWDALKASALLPNGKAPSDGQLKRAIQGLDIPTRYRNE